MIESLQIWLVHLYEDEMIEDGEKKSSIHFSIWESLSNEFNGSKIDERGGSNYN